jgi:tRNA A37 threonylcarbamoyladenosine synthetase subunit TsaC/SUA5/YrdC
VHESAGQLGESVACYLDGGQTPGHVASTIVDATGDVARVVRAGAIPLEALQAVAAVEGPGDEPR